MYLHIFVCTYLLYTACLLRKYAVPTCMYHYRFTRIDLRDFTCRETRRIKPNREPIPATATHISDTR